MPINKNAYERYLIIDRCLRENEAENRTVKKFAETYFAEFGKETLPKNLFLS